MNKGQWTFFSNHARILTHIAHNPDSPAESMARRFGLSLRSVQIIIDELEKSGFISRRKIGRCNHYEVDLDMRMQHRLEKKQSVGQLVSLLGASKREAKRELT